MSRRDPQEWHLLAASDIPENSRHGAIGRFAGYLLRRYVDPRVALELLQAWNFARCKPPLPESEVSRIVNSVAGHELRRRQR